MIEHLNNNYNYHNSNDNIFEPSISISLPRYFSLIFTITEPSVIWPGLVQERSPCKCFVFLLFQALKVEFFDSFEQQQQQLPQQQQQQQQYIFEPSISISFSLQVELF